ncbi:DUF4838 domain-containing protein [Paenibacillus agaridevorans]|uniref:DUF4838 domain-containing protein n=1 Tax=Paenibacillus agaridevorans TaxID=171404 RepID=UPI001BE4AFE4|nr:DUF4838 domain-containing protein [Paenibacillus agaridevorans]
MKSKLLTKRIFMLTLVMLIMVGAIPLYASASEDTPAKPHDHRGHWSEKTIERWMNQNMLLGYDDGTVKPNRPLTRGEFIVFLNRAFGLEEEVEITFTDLPASSWLYKETAKAVKAGYIRGRGDGTIGVNDIVTRQEAAVMIARVMGLPEELEDNKLDYSDAEKIAGWSSAAIAGLTKLGIMKGFSNGSFHPKKFMTRAEAVISMDRMLAQLEQDYIINTPGVYDFSDLTHALKWNVIIAVPGVTLRNLKLEGNIVLGSGLTEKDYTLDDVELGGRVIGNENPESAQPTATPTPPAPGSGGNNGGGDNGQSEGFMPVINGVARAIVVTEPSASKQVKDAANELIEYVRKSTGATLPLMNAAEAEALRDNATLIYVGFIGASANTAYINAQMVDLDNDGFVIHPEKTSNVITIIGPTDWGTEFGVYEFLERYVGVWWLLPGPDGEDVPQQSGFSVKVETVRQEPSFFSRAFDSNIENTTARKAWTRHNRIHNRMDHDHSFWKILPPAQYQTVYPDFYPSSGLINTHGGWQICFSVPQTIDVVSDIILDYFEQNPEADSFSLSVNDNGGFCEQNPSHPLYPDKINSIGYQDMSNIYFGWVNEVADIVFDQYPDKYIGTIAYHEVYDPPTDVILHPNVIVYITDERLSWADEDMGSAGKAFTESWLEAAPGVAFYEYLYGTPYSLPRPYLHQMSDIYKYAEQAGVKAHYTELYPNFGEGPKPWLASRLQWDAGADVDELLNEWYIRAVGEEAAPYLEAYFALWENFWEVTMIESTWFDKWVNSNPRRNFMNFYDSTYLKEVTEWDLTQSRALMEDVVEKAATPLQQARADILMQAFEYYEASALSYPSDDPLQALTTTEEATELLDQMIVKLAKAEYRLQLFDSFKTHEILQQPLDPRNYGKAWSGIRSEEVDMLIQWVKANPDDGAARTYIDDSINGIDSQLVKHYLKFILAEADGQAALNDNTSFETGISGDIDDAPPWWYWVDYGQNEDNVHRSALESRTGEYSIETIGLKIGGPVRDGIDVDPGFHSLSAYYYVPEESLSNGNISLFINFWDANGTHLGNAITTNKLARETAGKWALLEWVGEIPERIGGVPVKKVQFGTNIFDFEENERLYLDDFRFMRLSDPYVPNPGDDDEETTIINHNSSFEFGSDGAEDALPWSYWIDNSVGSMSRSNEHAKTDSYSLKIDGVQLGALSQIVAAPPTGMYKLSAQYYVPADQQSNGTVKLFMNFRDAVHNHLGAIPTAPLHVNEQTDQWNKLEWIGEIPLEMNGSEVKHLLLGIEAVGFSTGETIYFDDIELAPYTPVLPLPVNHNSSFEFGSDGAEDALPWSYWIDSGIGSVGRSTDQARTDQYSLKASGVQVAAISQIVAAPEAGSYRLSAYYYVPEGQSLGGTVKLFMHFRDAAHNHLGTIPTTHQEVDLLAGQWNLLEWSGEIPASLNDADVSFIMLGLELIGFTNKKSIYFDDIELIPSS